MRFRILALLAGCIAAYAQNEDALTNQTVIKMVVSGVSTATVIKTIQVADKVAFSFLPGDLQQFAQYKVPDEVFKAMAAKANGNPAPAIGIQAPTPPASTSKPASTPTAVAKVPLQQTPETQSIPAKSNEPAPASPQNGLPVKWSGIRTIFVDDLGKGEFSELIRDKIINRLTISGRFQVVLSPEKADARLTGSAEESLQARYANGTGGTAADATVVLRLIAKDETILWVSEAKNGRFSRSASSSVADNIVKALLKAASPPKQKK